MAEKSTKTELEQKVHELERELGRYKGREDSEELLSRRVEESAVRRIHRNFAIFGVIVSAFAFIGLFSFGKYLESTLSNSISRSVEQRLIGVESKVEEVRKRAEKTSLEAEINLKATLKRVEDMGRLLLEDVERRRQEITTGLSNESKRFEEACKRAEKQSMEILHGIRGELANLEKLTAVVRAPLRKKIEILKSLTLDRSAADVDVQRYMAILVLKEMEDAELVRRENVRDEARRVISELLSNYGLGDEFFAEVRFRILRAVAELGFVDLASRQVLNPESWGRGSLILLLGALRDGQAIPALATIVKNTKEPTGFRKMAIRSLHFIGANLPGEQEIPPAGIEHLWTPHPYDVLPLPFGWGHHDSEIEAMIPRGSHFFGFEISMILKALTSEQFDMAAEALSSVLSNTKETVPLRTSALRALDGFRSTKIIDAVKEILLTEWENFGQNAIDLLTKIRDETSVSALREFALNDKADTCLRLRGIIGLARTRTPRALTALREISKKDPDDVICAAAREGAKRLNETDRWLSYPVVMVARGWLGVKIQEVSAQLKERFGLNDRKGALVSDVTRGSPADKAGIERGDVIVMFDGKIFEGVDELTCIVALTQAGRKVILTLIREGETKNVEVRIGKPKQLLESKMR